MTRRILACLLWGCLVASINTAAVATPFLSGVTLQSGGETVIAGNAVSFSVGVSGSPSPSYQWQELAIGGGTWANISDGNGIAGTATATLQIASATTAMSGDQYQVVATNSAGSVTSTPVTLTVTPLPAGDTVVYSFSTLAGAPPGSIDGPESTATFSTPNEVAVDSVGNLYLADTGNNAIRKIDVEGNVTTLAGSPGNSGNVDGLGSSARFNDPRGLAVDGAGNLYVADSGNSTIRKITPLGLVTTLATSVSSFDYPGAMAADSVGNLYVANTYGNSVSKIDSAGNVTDISGASGLLYFPSGLALDGSGDLYVANAGNNTVAKIAPGGVVTTFAGAPGLSGAADGTGTAARFYDPYGLAADSSGNVYVADAGNDMIREITPAGAVTTLAGRSLWQGSADGVGSAAEFNGPRGVAVDASGNVFVADSYNSAIRKITLSGGVGTVVTLAGTCPIGGTDSPAGPGSAARFNQPGGVAVDAAGNAYVCDTFNNTIRKITSSGVVTSLAGTAPIAGFEDGFGTAAVFQEPEGLALDLTGNVYVADTANNAIRKITPAGKVTTLAGGGPADPGNTDGNGTAAEFAHPTGVAVDSLGDVFVSDEYNNSIRRIDPLGNVTTFARGLNFPWGIAMDSSGNLYVTVNGNPGIQKITPAGVMTTVAANTQLNGDLGGIAVDGAGNIYAANRSSTVIKITPGGTISVVAGGTDPGSETGYGVVARFDEPSGVAVDGAGNLYVADTGNDAVRLGAPTAVPFASVLPVAIVTPPQNETVNPGQNATFTVVASGMSPLSYQWEQLQGNGFTWASMTDGGGISGSTTATLTLSGVTPSIDFTEYRVIINNPSGSVTSSAAMLILNAAPSIALQPQNATLYADYLATFNAVVQGTAPISYQWQESQDGGATWSSLTDGNGISGSNSDTLFVRGLPSTLPALDFRVTASNAFGSVTSNPATYFLFALPFITSQPNDQIVIAGGSASITIGAGGNPSPTYQWLKSTDGGHTWSSLTDGNGFTGTETTELTINPTTGTMNGDQFEFEATNSVGVTTSTPVTLTVNVLPTISMQPVNLTAPAGTPATFSVAASGSPSPTYLWEESTDGGNSWANLGYAAGFSGATTATLTVLAPTAAMSGDEFRVEADNYAGNVTSNPVTLTVDYLTGIELQSGSEAVVAGQRVSFSVVEGGNPAPTYQWQESTDGGATWNNILDGNGITGTASPTLAIAEATDSMNGDQFQVVASNVTGTVASSPVTLSVTSFPAGDASAYDFTTLAGLPPGFVDATGSAARFLDPKGVATDSSGNIYIADAGNNAIRKVTPSGVVTTLAGGTYGSADGTGTTAQFYNPCGIAVDATGNVYAADTGNHRIRAISPAGVVVTLAGGSSGSTDGTGTAAQFAGPKGIAVDAAGTLYVADTLNSTIRKIAPGGFVTTLAGTVGQPGLVDATGSGAEFDKPEGIAVDGAGNVYVGDTMNRSVRKITPTGSVTTLAGNRFQLGDADGTGAYALFGNLVGLAVDGAGNVYVADSTAEKIRVVTPAGVVTTVAGGSVGNADGTGTLAQFDDPLGISVDGAGQLVVGDSGNGTIRRVAISSGAGVVTTLAGRSGVGSADSPSGPGSAARFYNPYGVAVDIAGNAYVADTFNSAIRKITPGGSVTTLAGSPAGPGFFDGTGNGARFMFPQGVAVDGLGNVYVADTDNETVRKITTAGVVTTLAGVAPGSEGPPPYPGYEYGSADGTGYLARFESPEALALDPAGNLYVADTASCAIRKVTPAGVVTTLAGSFGQPGSADGIGSAARFNLPTGLAVDGGGNVYVADSGNDTIREVSPAGAVTTLAGSPGLSGNVDGIGALALFSLPVGVAVDGSNNVFVADAGACTIRMISAGNVVTTLAGSPWQAGSKDGIGGGAQFNNPSAVAVDASNRLYVADTSSDTIRVGTLTVYSPPTITVQPASQTVNSGSGVVLSVSASSSLPSTYQWSFDGSLISGATGPSLWIPGVTSSGSGTYTVSVANSVGATLSTGAVLTVTPASGSSMIPTQPASQTIGVGGTVVFTVSTGGSVQSSLRADSKGLSGNSVSLPTYQWQFNGVNLADGNGVTGSTGPQLLIQGASPANSGTYDCIVTVGGNPFRSNAAGLQVETVSTPGSLSSISSRAFVGTGDNILIGGFFITGSTSATVLIQAIGPALSAASYNVSGTLQHPALTIHQTQGGQDVVLYANTGWGSNPVLLAAAASVYAQPVLEPESADSELLLTLPPGGYTAEVTGADGGTGVALCGIYQLQ